MFNQSGALKVGDFVVIGCQVDGKFVQSQVAADAGAKIKVEKITNEKGSIRIDLDWGSLGKSRIYAHDEGKLWHRVSNFN